MRETLKFTPQPEFSSLLVLGKPSAGLPTPIVAQWPPRTGALADLLLEALWSLGLGKIGLLRKSGSMAQTSQVPVAVLSFLPGNSGQATASHCRASVSMGAGRGPSQALAKWDLLLEARVSLGMGHPCAVCRPL